MENDKANKEAVIRFNKEVIEQCNRASFEALMRPDFINHTAMPGTDAGREGMWTNFSQVIHPAFSELNVEILDQVAEGDKVVTRKCITGLHTGPIMGIPATGLKVKIDVMDIVRLENGQYAEHWGLNTMALVIRQLSGN